MSLVSVPSALSTYFAVNNPLIYAFLSDGKGAGAFNHYEFTSTSVGGDDGNLIIIPGDKTSLIRKGDVIRIEPSTIRNIINIGLSGSGNTLVYVDKNISFATGLKIYSANNYRGEFRVYHGRKEQASSGSYLMDQVGPVIEATPDAQGRIEFNIQSYLKPFVTDPVRGLSLNRKNTNGLKNWGRFFFQWREAYDGYEPAWTPSTPGDVNMRWYVLGVKQLKSIGGVSMFPKSEMDDLFDDKGLFLSAFNTPDYVDGITENEVSFIWGKGAGPGLRVKEETLNNSKQVIGTQLTSLLPDGIEEVNRIRLNSHDSDYVRVSVEINPGYQEGYVAPGYVLIGYFEII